MAERRNYPRRAFVSLRVVHWLLSGKADGVQSIDPAVVQRVLKRLARMGLVKADGGGWTPTEVFSRPAHLIEVEG